MKVREVVIHNFRGIIDCTICLCDYSLLVGPNNAGKSTVFDAVRAFYEKDGFNFKPEEDFPFISTADKESWIELLFGLSTDEHSSLADIYKTSDKQLRLRKYFQTVNKTQDNKSATGSIFGYKNDGILSNEPFYGAKNVQSGKVGDIVYIPAVSKVDEHTKLSGPSALRDLLTNVLQDVVEASVTFNKFNADFDNFASGIKTETADDGRSLAGLEEELNKLLESWDTEFKLKLTAP
jgi:putative ATP-dependent endonuclease of OLD family